MGTDGFSLAFDVFLKRKSVLCLHETFLFSSQKKKCRTATCNNVIHSREAAPTSPLEKKLVTYLWDKYMLGKLKSDIPPRLH